MIRKKCTLCIDLDIPEMRQGALAFPTPQIFPLFSIEVLQQLLRPPGLPTQLDPPQPPQLVAQQKVESLLLLPIPSNCLHGSKPTLEILTINY